MLKVPSRPGLLNAWKTILLPFFDHQFSKDILGSVQLDMDVCIVYNMLS